MNKICFVLGTRPEIIKLYPVITLCKEQGIQFFIVHSNQHFSENMDKLFFEELNIPVPRYNLQVKEHSHAKMIASIMERLEDILIKESPSVVVVQGDTNTVLSAALTASKLNIKIAHIEAGLRSYDRTMPEEVNRVVTDHISEFLFCPTKSQKEILLHEGISSSNVHVVGNTIVDAVFSGLKLAEKNKSLLHYANEKYALLTLHRPSNVDDPNILTSILNAIYELSTFWGFPIYFPIHPRTKNIIETNNISIDTSLIKVFPPTSFTEMIMLEKNAQLVLTDSGGIQEEACILHVPCVTIRKNTERPETVEVGSNIVAGVEKNQIVAAGKKMFGKERKWTIPFGDGKAAQKILEVLKKDRE